MNIKTIAIAILVVGLIALGFYAFTTKQASAPSNEAMVKENAVESTGAVVQDEDGGESTLAVVTLTDNGFSPASVTVARGETIRFKNDSSDRMWVGADEHPTHTEYDGTSTSEHCRNGLNTGTSFDQCTLVARGEFWDYTFEKSGTFDYHNHVGASSVGTVVVQ